MNPFSILSKMRVPLAIAGAIALTSSVAWAYWTIGAAAGSTGGAAAATVNQGATPTASVTAIGREVSVSWGASTLSNGNAVSGYLVKRYPSGGGIPTISSVGSCSATVAATSCNEDDVPPGIWVYTVTPTVANWHGAESATSGVVTVAAATLTLNGSPFGNAAFTPTTANATGAITGFAGGEGVTYRLDTSTSLTGSPTSVDTSGGATITSLGIPKSAGDGAHTVSALGDAAYVPSSASAGIVIDTTAPTVSAQIAPSPNAAGWNNTSPVSVALAADDNGGSGVSQVKYTTDGSDPMTSGTAQVYSGSPFGVSSEGTTTVKYDASDVAGNVSPVQTQLVKIDTSPPVDGISLTSVTGGVYPTAGPLTNGTTVYYRGTASGSFRITNAVSDTVSGAASSETSPLAGGSSGWSHTASLVNTPAGGPYVSNAFSWSAGTGASPSETVTGRDLADNFSSTTLNLADDSTGPSGGSVDATGLGGNGGRYATSPSLNISFSKGTDSASGVAATGAMLLRASATLTSDGLADGVCGAYGSFSQVGSGDPSSPYTDSAAGGISSGHCYRYEYVAADNVGNTTTYSSSDVKVDTTGPSAPSVTLSSATGNTYISGNTVYINSQAGKSGGFQASATSSDSDSGILKLTFPTPAGFSSGGGDDTISPFTSGTYSWSGAVAASGAQTVTATNNANLTTTTSFTITPDTTNPTGGALTVNGTAATNGGSTSSTTDPNFAINSRTNYSDAGSGIGSSTLTIQSETLAGNSCGAPGSGGPYTSPTTVGGTTNPSITLGYCYLYTLTGTDNVGNTTSLSTTVKASTPFAGIDWTAITTSNNRTVSCNYTTITAVTCAVTGVGAGGTFTAKVELIDASHNPVTNTTGGSLTVSQTTTGQGTGSPTSTTVAQNASSAAGSFTVTLNNGSNKTATITASITVGGVTYTVNCQVNT
jgi:Fn3 domain-containing protein